ncbi:hypothetical protein PMAYCL1PPCAC_22486 [Pristionchus mayeri]|uniref:Uncharacterized protein n=1 Tax=Pristionchus mayeri TaxID=1317129 RepID=A0AAN5I6K6_9BILA|nr:hypothetical protein PMAYCL1PPCAC_22486 [Pristionchus mayeri]
MDEEALLGETAGTIGDRLISKQEEDALLNDAEPTTSLSVTTAVTAAVEQIPADPGHAPPKTEAAEVDEDESMQHTDTESNEASETRELENNDLAASSSNSESSSQSPAPTSSSFPNKYWHSMFTTVRKQLAKAEQKKDEHTRKKMNRLMEYSDVQRKRIVVMSNLQTSLDLKVKELTTNYERLAAQQEVSPAVFASSSMQQTPPIESGGIINNNSRKRRGEPVVQPQPIRRSNTGAPAPPPQGLRRRSSNGAPSPVVQQTQLQQHRSMHPQRAATQPTPPAQQRTTVRMRQQPSTPMPDPLPRPGQYQQAPSLGKVGPKGAPATAKTTPAAVAQHANGQRLQQVAQQHQPTPLRAPQHSMNGVAGAAAGPSPSAAALQRAASTALQQSRKRSHPQSQQQLVQQAVAVGSFSGSAAEMTTAQKLYWCALASAVLVPQSEPMTKTLKTLLQQTQHSQRMEIELNLNAADQRPAPTFAPRRIDRNFVVPGPVDKRKIEIKVEKQAMSQPTIRPSKDIPYLTDAESDQFGPQIELNTDHEDFTASGKVSGKIRFIPSVAWPESSARICVCYFIGTRNSEEWTCSDFATVEVSRDDEGHFKEVSVRFILSLGPQYFLAQGNGTTANTLHPLIWKETIGLVAFACAGDSRIRGDEQVYDFGIKKAQAERRKMDRYANNFAGFYQRHAATVEQSASPEARRAVQAQMQQQQQQAHQLQQQLLRLRAQAAAVDDDDDDIAIIE